MACGERTYSSARALGRSVLRPPTGRSPSVCRLIDSCRRMWQASMQRAKTDPVLVHWGIAQPWEKKHTQRGLTFESNWQLMLHELLVNIVPAATGNTPPMSLYLYMLCSMTENVLGGTRILQTASVHSPLSGIHLDHHLLANGTTSKTEKQRN